MVLDAANLAAVLTAAYLTYAGIRLLRDPARFTWPRLPWTLVVAIALTVTAITLAVGWTSLGRTVGMRLMGLRLVDRSGGPLGPGVALLRAVTCVLFPMGLLWSAVNRRNASVHDLVFGTSVIYDWQSRVPRTTAPAKPARPANEDEP